MTRCRAATTARDVMSDFTRLAVAPRLRSPNPVSDGRKVEKEPMEKEKRDPQAHHAGGVDAGEHPAALLVDDHDLADGHLSQWGAVRPELSRPQPVQSRGAPRLPHAVRAARIVVKGEFHSGRWSTGMGSQA